MSGSNKKLYIFVFDKDGVYGEPTIIPNTDDLSVLHDIILKDITTASEIRVVNSFDEIVFHIENQCLLFPVPEEFKDYILEWDTSISRFCVTGKKH